MSKKMLVSLSLIVLTISLAACTGSAPKQIAISPKEAPIAQYPSQITINYRAYMELKVSNVDNAAASATQLAYDYGGYLASSQSWYTNERKVTNIELAVPTVNFDSLRVALRGLGDLVNESISAETSSGSGYLQQYSTITVQLRSSGVSLPPVEIGGWHPLNTIQKAFQVFLTIFGFLADIAIWTLIVVGPFFLIFLGIRVALRRMRRQHHSAP